MNCYEHKLRMMLQMDFCSMTESSMQCGHVMLHFCSTSCPVLAMLALQFHNIQLSMVTLQMSVEQWLPSKFVSTQTTLKSVLVMQFFVPLLFAFGSKKLVTAVKAALVLGRMHGGNVPDQVVLAITDVIAL